MKAYQKRKKALEELISLFSEIDNYIDLIIVEGQRDLESLRSLGFTSSVEILNHKGIGDHELAEILASKYSNILILTDFDEEGLILNKKFAEIFELKGVKVEKSLRNKISKFMSMIGVYTVEALDNIKNEIL
jgi:5S rRNA maturation endonuclease (ribonuclease M5)